MLKTLEDARRRNAWWWEHDDIFDVPISLTALAVRFYLIRLSDRRAPVEISMSKIGKKLRLSRSTIYRAMEELIAYHLIEVDSGAGTGVVNKYVILDVDQWRKPPVKNPGEGVSLVT